MSYNLFHNLPELARKGGFTLCDGGEEKDESIDWRFIASIDTTRIVKESDYEKLDQCIPFLIRSSVGNLLNVRILDPAIARIYIISQLCLQYLLFCTNFLDKSIYQLRDDVYNYQKKTLKLEEVVEKRDEEIVQLQKKLKRQDILKVFPCKKCTKNFVSAALLDNHIFRKHQQAQLQESKDKDLNLINTIKFELEIKQLKQRLFETEKELTEMSKMSCEKCQQNSQRKFQSVAIQSNFEEKEKDDIEKEAICKLLSNQMKNFEEWKQNEESRYRSEISELRTKLDETIDTLKLVGTKREASAPAPAPRTLKTAQKSIEPSMPPTSVFKPPENEWKSRYEELEKMYEEHQKRMTSTVTSIEQTYSDKLTKIEESVKKLTEDREKLHKELQSRVEKPQLPLTPKVINKTFAQDSTDSSSESEIVVKPKAISKPIIVKSAPVVIDQVSPNEKSIISSRNFSAQKFSVRPKTAKNRKSSPKKLVRSTREEAVDLFNQRLKMFGISQDDELMSKPDFNRVQSEMVSLRDEKRKKSKNFFITRKKIQSQVEKIFLHRKKPIDKSSFGETFKKVKVIEHLNELPKETVIDPVPPAVKLTFRDDLEQMLQKKLPIQEKSRSSFHVSKPEEEEPTLQASTSKKKVLFDLKHLNEQKRFEEIQEMREEDESDFDISSFASEVEEIK